MTLLSLFVALVVVGLILWLIDQIPMDPTIKRIIHVVAIVLVILWLVLAILPLAHLGSVRLR